MSPLIHALEALKSDPIALHIMEEAIKKDELCDVGMIVARRYRTLNDEIQRHAKDSSHER